jgi:hypothetical protein
MEHCHDHHGFHRPWRLFHIVGLAIGGVVVASIFALAFGWLVMLLWNWLMPMLFGLKLITYWQAFGILVLSKLVFSGIGGHRPHRGHGFRHHKRPWSHNDDWFTSPGGDRRNWVYYREYWKERGKTDFEAYLKETGRGNAGHEDEERMDVRE